jgi:hypothetical protein
MYHNGVFLVFLPQGEFLFKEIINIPYPGISNVLTGSFPTFNHAAIYTAKYKQKCRKSSTVTPQYAGQLSRQTYAMSTREWKVLQLNKEVTELKIHESGSMEIEIWKYDLELFA